MHEVKLPQLGQSVEEAQIITWYKHEGDAVVTGDALFSIQTDKAEIDVEAPAAGVLRKILLQPDIEVPVLSVVALIGTAAEALPDLAPYLAVFAGGGAKPAATAKSAAPAQATARSASAVDTTTVAAPATDSFVSPRAKCVAAAHHVNASRLNGSGVGGRVLEEDVRAYLAQMDDTRITPVARRLAGDAGIDVRGIAGTGIGGRITKEDIEAIFARASVETAPAPQAGVKRVALSPMRRRIAERMSESKFSAPHYYVTVEVDMHAAKAFRAGLAFKASYNDLVLYAAAKSLQEFPQVNARWAGDAVEEVEDINLGMAVALPTGLIVPVIRRAQTLSLEELSRTAKAQADKAQAGKLLPDDYTGNTFTVSNLGALGVDHFTAIINQPDSAILAVGQMKDRPVVVDGQIAARPIMKLTLSSDHRVIDGAVAARFMGRLREIMEAAAF